MFILLNVFLCASQYAYYPKICPILAENLKVCTGQSYTFTLSAADPLNPSYTCSSTSSPEVCTFVRINSTTDGLSVTSAGVVTYTPAVSDASKVFLIGVYDNNTMNTSDYFNYYSMTDIYELQFSITDLSSFPSINYDSYSSACLTCTNCSTCVNLTCGYPYVGQIKPSVNDANRFTYTLYSSSNINITVLSNGGFVISSLNCKDSGIS